MQAAYVRAYEHLSNLAADRVRIVMSGKFLPFQSLLSIESGLIHSQNASFHQLPHDAGSRASMFCDQLRFRRSDTMQHLIEEVCPEQRFINEASPLRAHEFPLIHSRSASEVFHENLCPTGNHILLVLHAEFREAVSIAGYQAIQSQLLSR